ncbi:MAG TPA: hypothetical protein VHZ76_07505 [Gammaproteobacteria bacterium]|jgi:excinuclease UvrABC nuclease subunit|nr:hypothetical protein [Gammaproteobacteria bacterium]
MRPKKITYIGKETLKELLPKFEKYKEIESSYIQSLHQPKKLKHSEFLTKKGSRGHA